MNQGLVSVESLIEWLQENKRKLRVVEIMMDMSLGRTLAVKLFSDQWDSVTSQKSSLDQMTALKLLRKNQELLPLLVRSKARSRTSDTSEKAGKRRSEEH